jgi:ATP-binding cassette, subfamily B (MDR/TAP), member 1
VQAALDEAMASRTTIAVAHRLSTIKGADVIFVIEDGIIAEQGTHEELQALRGRYYAMCLAQSFGED